jgi:hypothetical protein
MTPHVLHQQEGGLQIDVVDPIPIRFALFEEGVVVARGAGAIDETIDPAEGLEHCGDEITDRARVGEIRDERPGGGTRSLEVADDALEPLRVEIERSDRGAGIRHRPRRGRPDPRGGTRNQSDLAGERFRIHDVPSPRQSSTRRVYAMERRG